MPVPVRSRSGAELGWWVVPQLVCVSTVPYTVDTHRGRGARPPTSTNRAKEPPMMEYTPVTAATLQATVDTLSRPYEVEVIDPASEHPSWECYRYDGGGLVRLHYRYGDWVAHLVADLDGTGDETLMGAIRFTGMPAGIIATTIGTMLDGVELR